MTHEALPCAARHDPRLGAGQTCPRQRRPRPPPPDRPRPGGGGEGAGGVRGAVKPVIETAKAAELLLLAALARLDSFPPCEAPSRGLFPVQVKHMVGAILAGFRDL